MRVAANLAGEQHVLEAARTITAWANGFISMELAGAFKLGGNIDRAYEFGIACLADALVGQVHRPSSSVLSARAEKAPIWRLSENARPPPAGSDLALIQ